MSLNLLNEYHEIVLHMSFIAQDDRLVLNDRPLLDHWRDEVQVPGLKNNLFGGDFEISVLDLDDEYRILAGNKEMHTFVKRGIAGPVVAVAHQRLNYDQSGVCNEFTVEMRKGIETGQNFVHAEQSLKEKIDGEPSRDQKPSRKTYRINGVPKGWELDRLTDFLRDEFIGKEDGFVEVQSLCLSLCGKLKTATAIFDIDNQRMHQGQWNIRLPANRPADQRSINIEAEFLGLTMLTAPSVTEEHQVDIVAMTGLGGHAFGSFKERGGNFMWLRDSIHLRLPNARVMTYGYESHVPQSRSFQNIADLASNFQRTLEMINRANDDKPILIIAHSLGGLIVQEALMTMLKSDEESENLAAEAVRGLVFFGVPHRGMDIKSLIPMVTGNPNEELIQSLNKYKVDDKKYEAFPAGLGEGKPEVIYFYETSKSSTAVKGSDGKWSMRGPLRILVDKDSATNSARTDRVCPINRNHSNLVKFSEHDHILATVLEEIERLAVRMPKVRFEVRNAEPKRRRWNDFLGMLT
ncbi:hypothetical protein AUP68_03765 [Ilyonectria robusta]